MAISCLSGIKNHQDLAEKRQNAPSLASTIANDSFQRSGQLNLAAVLPLKCARDVISIEHNNVISSEHNIVISTEQGEWRYLYTDVSTTLDMTSKNVSVMLDMTGAQHLGNKTGTSCLSCAKDDRDCAGQSQNVPGDKLSGFFKKSA